MHFYVGLFPNSEVIESQRYDSGENEGKLQYTNFVLNGREIVCIDSAVKHGFGFTPAIPIFVDFETLSALEDIFCGAFCRRRNTHAAGQLWL